MKIVASICRVAGERVAVVAVQKQVTEYPSEADRYVEALMPAFDGIAVVLMARDEAGIVTWYGSEELCRKLSGVPVDSIPWQEMEVEV